MTKPVPEWFTLSETLTPSIMRCVADAADANGMNIQVRHAAKLAHWFLLDSMMLANRANRDGMHANALALTRQCIEAIGVIELGICGHPLAESMLLRWDNDQLSPGKLRAWLQEQVWTNYGTGLWMESWPVFMREFAAAVQPYAHYGRSLAQWQLRLHGFAMATDATDAVSSGLIEMRPRAYDPQKATRITLFHALLTYTLGRICGAAGVADQRLRTRIGALGNALGKSPYLDGHQTNWGQQFWAMVWSRDGSTMLE